MKIHNEYARFIQNFDWNYFITCRTPYKIHTKTVRDWIEKLFNRSYKVEKVFFVSERDKGDWNNLHVHMLLDTNTDMTYKEVRYGLGNISVGDYQIVYDQDEGDSLTYTIYFDELDGLQDPIKEELTETTLEVNVESGTTYYWRVKTSDGQSSSYTLVYSFVVN